MDPDELFRVLKRRPFEPVRIHLSDGSSYDVTHPDQVMVGRRSLHIGVRPDGEKPFQHIEIVSNIHITRVRPLNKKREKTR